MSFSISGSLDGRPVELTWEDGDLDGDTAARLRVDELVALGELIDATPTGPIYTAGLEPDYVAAATIRAALDHDRPLEFEGIITADPAAEIPAGAKG